MTSDPVVGWTIILIGATVLVASFIYRVVTPAPADDLAAIQLFLKNRDQVQVEARKTWFGRPWRRIGRAYYPSGRPYRVIAQSNDGARWIHRLVALEKDSLGAVVLRQRINGVWFSVLQ
jgi:hypothetical protein